MKTAASRSNQRRELIKLFEGMAQGDELTYDEIFVYTELDYKAATDKQLIYDVRNHCRDVLGFNVDAVPGKGVRRVRDDEIAARLLERRQGRVHRQALRGIAESVAVADLSALDMAEQRRILSHQAVFGAIALGSRLDVSKQLATSFDKPTLAKMDPDTVIAVAMRMKQ